MRKASAKRTPLAGCPDVAHSCYERRMSQEASPGRGPWMTQLTRQTGRALGIQPDETAAVFAAGLFQLCFVGGVSLLRAASNTLIPDANTLPLLYVCVAAITGPLVLFLGPRAIRRRAPSFAFLAWAVVLLGCGWLVGRKIPFAPETFYVAVEVYAATLSVTFWAQIGDAFDLKRSRRVAALIGAFGMTGAIWGGLLTQAYGAIIGPVRMVPIGSATLGLCLFLASGLNRPRGKRGKAKEDAPVSPSEAGAYIALHGLPRSIAAMAGAGAMVAAFADFLFRMRAKEALSASGQLQVFGELSSIVGAVSVTVFLALGPLLLSWFGLFGFLALAPIACMAAGIAASLDHQMWAISLLKAVEQITSIALMQSAVQALYGPMPDTVRGTVRSLVDGISDRLGYALGGLLAATLLATNAVVRIPVASAVMSAAMLVALFRVRVQYLRMVRARIGTTARTDPSQPSVQAVDAGQRVLLDAAIQSTDDEQVLASLYMQAQDSKASLEPTLTWLLRHASARVRREAAVLAGERGVSGVADRLAELAVADESLVQEAAIVAVARLRPYTAQRLLEPLLNHSSIVIRATVIGVLAPINPGGRVGQALQALLDRGASADPEERCQVARLLGRLGPGSHARRLRVYLRDRDPRIRQAACDAAGESGESALVSDLLDLLPRCDTRPNARAALARHGEPILERLELLLNDRTVPPALRYRLPRLIREIGTARGMNILLAARTTDDPFLQSRVTSAVSRLREAQPGVAFDRKLVHDAAGRYLAQYAALLAMVPDIAAALGPQHLLMRALNDRLDRALECAVRMLGALNDQRAMLNAYNRFVFGAADKRAYAAEVMQHLVSDVALSRQFVGFLERWHGRADLDRKGSVDRAPERLMVLLKSDDLVLRAVAIATLRRVVLAPRGIAPKGPATSGVLGLASRAQGAAWEALLSAPPLIQEEGLVSETIVEKVLFLERVDIFAESNVDDLTAVARFLKERTCKQGEAVYLENDVGDSLFIVVEGTVRIEKDGRQIVDLTSRHSFGETGLLDTRPRAATAMAATDVKLLVLERADFMDLVSDRVELLRGVFTAITKHLQSMLDAAAAGRITSPGLIPVSATPRVKSVATPALKSGAR